MKRALITAAVTLSTPLVVTSQTVLADGPACSSCSILFDPQAVLGTADGPGALANVIRVVVDVDGRYWVFSEGEMPKLFDASGKYIGSVGRKGKGPGEFEWPANLWQLTRDSIAVVDAPRIHVFSSGLRYIRTVISPVLDPGSSLVIKWPTSVVINSNIPTQARFGLPFHLVDFSSVTPRLQSSFGGSNERITAANAYTSTIGTLSKSRSGGYWAARANRYVITKFSDKHESEVILERRPSWFSGVSTMGKGGPEFPPNPRCLGVTEDEDGLLWSFCLKPAPTWRKAWERVRDKIPQRGRVEMPAVEEDREYLYVTHVEVIDQKARTVVATVSSNLEVISILPNRYVAVLGESDEGVPIVRIFRMNLIGYGR
jgi:hypothetical protein